MVYKIKNEQAINKNYKTLLETYETGLFDKMIVSISNIIYWVDISIGLGDILTKIS